MQVCTQLQWVYWTAVSCRRWRVAHLCAWFCSPGAQLDLFIVYILSTLMHAHTHTCLWVFLSSEALLPPLGVIVLHSSSSSLFFCVSMCLDVCGGVLVIKQDIRLEALDKTLEGILVFLVKLLSCFCFIEILLASDYSPSSVYIYIFFLSIGRNSSLIFSPHYQFCLSLSCFSLFFSSHIPISRVSVLSQD